MRRKRERSRWANGTPRASPRAMNSTTPVSLPSRPALTSTISRPFHSVSRDHAVIVHRGHDYYLDDCGSLNGTYVNRKRIESHRLADGDELQVGKYKLAFLSR